MANKSKYGLPRFGGREGGACQRNRGATLWWAPGEATCDGVMPDGQLSGAICALIISLFAGRPCVAKQNKGLGRVAGSGMEQEQHGKGVLHTMRALCGSSHNTSGHHTHS